MIDSIRKMAVIIFTGIVGTINFKKIIEEQKKIQY